MRANLPSITIHSTNIMIWAALFTGAPFHVHHEIGLCHYQLPNYQNEHM